VQEALIRALSAWEVDAPSDPEGWLITVSWRAFVDMARSDTARLDREVRFDSDPPTGVVPSADDTLHLYFLSAHPDLTPSSAVALNLRAAGGLTTRQIARAYLVPESTMAQPPQSHPPEIVPLAEQDRRQWDTELVAEGVAILQAALAQDQLGEYQTQAAIAALHADAPRFEDTRAWCSNIRASRPSTSGSSTKVASCRASRMASAARSTSPE